MERGGRGRRKGGECEEGVTVATVTTAVTGADAKSARVSDAPARRRDDPDVLNDIVVCFLKDRGPSAAMRRGWRESSPPAFVSFGDSFCGFFWRFFWRSRRGGSGRRRRHRRLGRLLDGQHRASRRFREFRIRPDPTFASHAWHSLTKCFRSLVCGARPSTYSANCSTVRVGSTHSHTQKTSPSSSAAGAKTGLWYPAAWFAIANSFQSAAVIAAALPKLGAIAALEPVAHPEARAARGRRHRSRVPRVRGRDEPGRRQIPAVGRGKSSTSRANPRIPSALRLRTRRLGTVRRRRR